jgi:hypothetical protein
MQSVTDYVTITCNLKNGWLQITSYYMNKFNRLHLITITNSYYPISESMLITTDIVSSNPTHGDVYSLQQYVIRQWLAVGSCFSMGTPVSSTNKTDCHNVTEILLKVALNTLTQLEFQT